MTKPISNLKIPKKIKNNQIWFTHIPKNTGSSITNIFDKKYCYLNGSRSYVFKILYNIFEEPKDIYSYFIQKKYLNNLRYDKNYSNFIKNNSDVPNRMNFWHVPMSFWKPELLKKIKNNNIIFCVIRNPYERVVSIYNFWISWYNTSLNHSDISSKKKLGFIFNEKRYPTKEGLNNFIKKIYSSDKYIFNLDGHLLPQYLYLYNEKKIQIPHVIIRYENLKKDFSNFIDNYKLNLDINDLEQTHILKSKSKITIKDLTKESIKLINKYYNLDFDYLGYEKI
jgi:hypothetical protein